MRRSTFPFPAGPAVLLAALLAAAPVRAGLPWSDPRLPWRITPDAVREGRFTAAVEPLSGGRVRLTSDFSGVRRERVLAAPAPGAPRLVTGHALLDALYRMALEDLAADVRPDGALMAGEKWPGVWTRDVSYATHLAVALLRPDAARASLLAKTFDGRVRQDTGTGGAWPVSTDRAIWAVAARELWLATGDRAWLARARALVERMALEDRATALDPRTGLMFGESTFMDWREQSYPRWFQPADIFGSRALGTNVVHAAAWRALAALRRAEGLDPGPWDEHARALAANIVRYFDVNGTDPLTAFRYPDPDGGPSGGTEALGNALAILTDVLPPERARALLERYPLTVYGVPTIHPQLPGIPPYHNDSVWPFVVAYWALAGQHAGHPATFFHGLGALVRSAALMLTEKENLVADTGRPEGTAINSDRQLWSVAGLLAVVQRGLFGLQLTESGLRFAPVVPEGLAEPIRLESLHMRGAVLDIEVYGHGDRLLAAHIDHCLVSAGKPLPYPPGGHHLVTLIVGPGREPGHLRILPPGPLPSAPPRAPLAAAPSTVIAARLSGGLLPDHSITVEMMVPTSGTYRLRARYANGAGPINTDRRCGLRAVLVDGVRAGVLVMPQRGTGNWQEFGDSAAVLVSLTAGAHRIALAPDALARNMSGEPDAVRLEALTLER